MIVAEDIGAYAMLESEWLESEWLESQFLEPEWLRSSTHYNDDDDIRVAAIWGAVWGPIWLGFPTTKPPDKQSTTQSGPNPIPGESDDAST